MNTAGREGRVVATAARFTWEHPEAGSLALAATAWAFMLVHAVGHGAHAHHHAMTPPAELFHWLAMIVAMMVPLMTESIRGVAFGAYPERRHLAIATLLAGYLGVWALFGAPVALLRAAAFTHDHRVAAIAFAAAAAFTLSPWHARGLRGCHHHRALAPSGLRAIGDGVRYGGRLGLSCALSCFPLMLACALTGHSVVAMIGTGVIGAWERLALRPPIRGVAAATLGLAAFHAILALVA